MSQTDEAKAAAVKFGGCNPIFRVRSVAESVDYYVRVLGFKLDWSLHLPQALSGS